MKACLFYGRLSFELSNARPDLNQTGVLRKKRFKMNQINKYPRTQHIQGSRLQAGDEDLASVPFSSVAGRFLVVEEKIDGANCGISFYDNELLLQSRGHYLTGGYRERHFNLLKTWATVFSHGLYNILGHRYIMYGEWMYAKHTVFYDCLPHYFMEFDIYDTQRKVFLSTGERRKMLHGADFIKPVPVLYSGMLNTIDELKSFLTKSLYKTENWRNNLRNLCSKDNLDYELVLGQTDNSDMAEGLYIKFEEDGIVRGRYKFVRSEFLARILASDSHWLDRPIITNLLPEGVTIWTS